ncbi:hypothetical protein [Pseudomonas sp. NPDC008258]|uniref:hypothetical protein n=1 Tax=Pseudomonas sp. NPDC008258 TaxID=3364418 RepID=UPI0036EE8753
MTITGCATVMADRTWHGKHFLYISCSGLTSSWAHCLKQAEQSCGSTNYEVIAQSNMAQEDSNDYLLGINPAGFSSRDAVVLCDPPGNEHQKLSRKFLRRLGAH